MPLNGGVLKKLREQHGLISRAQARDTGMRAVAIDSLLRAGDWETAGRGVYRLPEAERTWLHRAAAVCLQGAPYAALSFQSAAYVWGMDGFSRYEPKTIDVSIPRERQLWSSDEHIMIRTARRLEQKYFRYKSGVTITSLQRTLVDLAGVETEAKVDVGLDWALRKDDAFAELLIRVLAGLSPRAYPGIAMLRDLMKERTITDSALEAEVRRLVWAAGLPSPEVGFNVCAGDRWIAKVDFAFPEIKLCIPAQSLLHHTKAKRFYRDNEQISELVAAGWMPLPTTKRDVLRTPLRFMERLREAAKLAMQRAGHEGPGDGDPSLLPRWHGR